MCGCQQASSRRPLSYHAKKAPLIINAVGSDRVGIVSDMTQYVTEAGGNVCESPAIRLGTHFSMTMLVEVPEKNVANLMDKIKSTNLHATVFEADTNAYVSANKAQVGYSGKFVLEGADHPGIIHKVTSLLCRHGLDIARMETSDEVAPMGGTTLFKMVGVAQMYEPLAKGFNPKQIKMELEELGDSINCDIYMEDCDASEGDVIAA